jgi:hypothetical protein
MPLPGCSGSTSDLDVHVGQVTIPSCHRVFNCIENSVLRQTDIGNTRQEYERFVRDTKHVCETLDHKLLDQVECIFNLKQGRSLARPVGKLASKPCKSTRRLAICLGLSYDFPKQESDSSALE